MRMRTSSPGCSPIASTVPAPAGDALGIGQVLEDDLRTCGDAHLALDDVRRLIRHGFSPLVPPASAASDLSAARLSSQKDSKEGEYGSYLLPSRPVQAARTLAPLDDQIGLLQHGEVLRDGPGRVTSKCAAISPSSNPSRFQTSWRMSRRRGSARARSWASTRTMLAYPFVSEQLQKQHDMPGRPRARASGSSLLGPLPTARCRLVSYPVRHRSSRACATFSQLGQSRPT